MANSEPIRTIPQRTILSLLNDTEQDCVLVHGVYLSDVLALQAEGLVSHRVVNDQIEVRLNKQTTITT